MLHRLIFSLTVLALTLDPAHDTPDRLKAFGQAHGADFDRWTLATGPEELMTDGLPSTAFVLAAEDLDFAEVLL